MHRSSGAAAASLAAFVVIGAIGAGPAMALEAPLSRASFERALAEGSACASTRKVAPYVVVKKKRLDNPLQAMAEVLTSEETVESYVTVRLETPYLHVRALACQAKLWRQPLDEAEIWKWAQGSPTVSLWVETESTQTTRGDASYQSSSVRTAGPQVWDVYIRHGDGLDATTISSVSVEGVAYDFPAAALQGEGPFTVVIRTDSPKFRKEVKLKPATLAKP